MSDHDLDLCPRCGIQRQRTKSEASCGSGYMAVGCFARAERAEAALREIEFLITEADYPALHTNEVVRIARAALAKEEVTTPDSRDASGGAPVSRDARHPRSDTTALAALAKEATDE